MNSTELKRERKSWLSPLDFIIWAKARTNIHMHTYVCLCSLYIQLHIHAYTCGLVQWKASCASTVVGCFNENRKFFQLNPKKILWLFVKRTDNHVHAQHYPFHNARSRRASQETSSIVLLCFSSLHLHR